VHLAPAGHHPDTEVPLNAPIPIVALDVATRSEAEALLDRLEGSADFVKVGLQLFTAAGPEVVRALQRRGCRIFLDLKLHDIPNTVAGAVRSAASLGVQLVTVHAVGGAAMLRAARDAAEAPDGPELLAVTVLTSHSAAEIGEAWGRSEITVGDEVERLARMAAGAGIDGVVASVHEIDAVRRAAPGIRVLTPGIRLAGDAPGDQARIATPAQAASAGARWIILGRAVTAAADPAAALERARTELAATLR
jgi:orotidine-5'-phosphate decarboxylase